jgi:hypothetical protein
LPLLLPEFARRDLPHDDRVFLDVINVIVLVSFVVDYVVEFALAQRRPIYVRKEWTSLSASGGYVAVAAAV